MSFCPLNQVGSTRSALGCPAPVVHPPAPPDAPPRGTLTAGGTPHPQAIASRLMAACSTLARKWERSRKQRKSPPSCNLTGFRCPDEERSRYSVHGRSRSDVRRVTLRFGCSNSIAQPKAFVKSKSGICGKSLSSCGKLWSRQEQRRPTETASPKATEQFRKTERPPCRRACRQPPTNAGARPRNWVSGNPDSAALRQARHRARPKRKGNRVAISRHSARRPTESA